MLESGIGRAHNIHLSTLPNFTLPGDIAASRRYYAGWFGWQEIHVLARDVRDARASAVPGSLEALRLTPLHEYAPATVKLATVGHGQADKRAIGHGVALRLGLRLPPAADAADALALALCHLQQASLMARVAIATSGGRT